MRLNKGFHETGANNPLKEWKGNNGGMLRFEAG
jgi:hypothetical protein